MQGVTDLYNVTAECKRIPHDVACYRDEGSEENGIVEKNLLPGIELIKVEVFISAYDITAEHFDPLQILRIKTAVPYPDEKDQDQGGKKHKAEEMMDCFCPMRESENLLKYIQGAKHETEPCYQADHTTCNKGPVCNFLNRG